MAQNQDPSNGNKDPHADRPSPSYDPEMAPPPKSLWGEDDPKPSAVPDKVTAPSGSSKATWNTKAPKKTHRKRNILLGLAIILLLLILAAPTILTSRPVFSYILKNFVNPNLNGNVEVNEASVGWFSGLSVSGVTVSDDKQKPVIQLKQLQSELTVIDVIRGQYGLGNLIISDAKFTLARLPDGSLNLQNLAMPSTSTSVASSSSSGDSRLPALSGTLTIQDSRLTILDTDGKPASFVDVSGSVKIPDINSTIIVDLTLATRAQGGQAGKLLINGNWDLVKNGLLNLTDPKANLVIDLSNVDLAIFKLLLPPDAVANIAGSLTGVYRLDMPATGPITLTNTKSLTGQGFSVLPAGPDAERISSPVLELVLPTITIDRPNGLLDWQSYRLRTPDGQNILLTTSLGTVTLGADVTPKSLLAMADNKAPGSTGRLELKVDSDLRQLAEQLPNTVQVRDGLILTRGTANYSATAELSPTRTQWKTELNIKDIAARNKSTGTVLTIKPVDLSANGNLLGGGGILPNIPNITDLNVTLNSEFARIELKGEDLARVRGSIWANLDLAQQEFGQVFDFKGLKLTGAANTTIVSTGDLASPTGSAKVTIATTVNGVNISGLKGYQPLNINWAQSTLSASLERGTGLFISGIKDGLLTLKAGSEQSPTVDFSANANLKFTGTRETGIKADGLVTITRFDANLPAITRDYAPLFDFLTKAKAYLPTGTLQLTAKTVINGDKINVTSFEGKIANLKIERIDQAGRRVIVMNPSTFDLDLAGLFSTADGGWACRVSKFTLLDANQLVRIAKSEGGDLSVALDKNGQLVDCSGELQAALSAEYFATIRNNLLPDLGASNPRLVGGTVTSSIIATSQQGKPITLSVKSLLDNWIIQLPGGGQKLPAQSAQIQIDGKLARNGKSLQTDVRVHSTPLDLIVKDLDIQKTGYHDLLAILPQYYIRNGNIELDIKDLKTLGVLARGLLPEVRDAKGQVISGLTLVPESGQVRLTGEIAEAKEELLVKGLSFRSTEIGFTHAGVARRLNAINTLSLDASLQADSDGRVGAIQVSNVMLDAGAAQMTSSQLNVTGLTGDGPLAANGVLNITGDIAKVNAMLIDLTGKPIGDQLSGKFILDTQVVTRGNEITPTGTLTISDFVGGSGQQQVREKSIKLSEALVLNTALESIMIRKFDLITESSKAIALSIRGGIQKYDTDRNIDMSGSITYDAATLLSLVRSILSPEMQAQLAGAMAEGKYTRNFKISGSYPAGLTFDQAIAKLKGDVAFTLDKFNAPQLGIDLTLLDLKTTLADGTMRFDPPVAGSSAPSARINGGTLNLAGLGVTFKPEGPRINAPEKFVLISQASMNPAFTNNVLGKFINPAFANPQTSRGLMDVTINYCRNLNVTQFSSAGSGAPLTAPVDNRGSYEQWQQQGTPQSTASAAPTDLYGQAQFRIDITEVQLGNELLNTVINSMASDAISQQTLRGDITNGLITLANGKTTSDLPLVIDQKYTMRLAGDVKLEDLSMQNMRFEIPTALLAAVRKASPQVQQYVPANLTIPISGSMGAAGVKVDIGKAIGDLLVQASQKALLNGVLERGTNSTPTPTPGSTTPPAKNATPAKPTPANPPSGSTTPGSAAPAQGSPSAEPAKPDPVGGIFNMLEQERQRKEQEKERKRQEQQKKQEGR